MLTTARRARVRVPPSVSVWKSQPSKQFSSNIKEDNKNIGIIDKYFGKESCEASPTFKNRWAMAVPAFLSHMCVGSPWAWSLVVCKALQKYN